MSLKKIDIAIMAFATGAMVANIYYCQPLVVLIAKDFHIVESVAGRITYLTQIGYALGLLFLVPLGDMVERKKQILITIACSVLALLMAALSPSFIVLGIASLVLGFSSVVPQLIIPLAANLADPSERGKVVGMVMSGLLVGVLLSRTLSGIIGSILGWRAMFFIAAGICALLLILIQKKFPVTSTSFKGTYITLMKSLWHLIRDQPLLREASAISITSFAVFGGFWTSMVLFLSEEPYHFDSGKIGLFGIAGAVGVLAAPTIGKITDKKNPRVTIGFGLCIIFFSLVMFYFTSTYLLAFILGVVLLDLAHQGIHVSNQIRVYTLIPEARNRLNTVYMTSCFIGASCGSALSLELWKWHQWKGVCIGLSVLILIGLIIFSSTYSSRKTVIRIT